MSNYLDKFRLDNKLVVITGAFGNLGSFWVEALLQVGARVAGLELPSVLPSEKIKSLIKRFSDKFLKYFQADVTDIESLSKVHREIKKNMGSIDILVNNAGIDVPPTKLSKEINKKLIKIKYDQMWQVNVQGTVNCIEEFATDMKEKRSGSIVNIGSLYLERAPDEKFYDHLDFDKPWAYGSTKAAVDQVTRHFAARLAKYGIRVNTLSPGGVYDKQDKEFVRKYSLHVPMGRMADKEKDLGGPLVFLSSDASSYITGINLQVNGGYTVW